MNIGIVTLFPDMFAALSCGITGRAITQKLLTLNFWNPRDYTSDKHRTVDDRPYGGGPGMVMLVQPLRDAVRNARNTLTHAKVIHLSPQGKLLTQQHVQTLAKQEQLILVAGRYEGIDERIISNEVDEEWSIGDYVLSGGELAAMVMIDAITRLLPGALGHHASAQQDSFTNGLLDYPHYTRPEEIDGLRVPEILLSGDHQAIARWRLKQALGRTWLRRPDLLQSLSLSTHEQNLLAEFINEHQTASKPD
jgi:tRNA (guanine37-N1)-methyltransferase